MKIRLAEFKDIDSICNLYLDFFAFNANQQPQYYKKAIETGNYPKSVIDSDTEDILIAIDEDAIIGLLHIAEEKTPPFDCFVSHKYGTIVDLFVLEDCRKKGVGHLLIKSAEQWAKIRGLDYLELNVLQENENGIQFYEHEQFKAVSLIMRCEL